MQQTESITKAREDVEILRRDEAMYINNDGGYPIKTKAATNGELCDAFNIHFGFIESALFAIDGLLESGMELEPDKIAPLIFEVNRKMEDIKKIEVEAFNRLG